MSIKLLPANERPREKLMEHGAEQLSDAELVAIFLRTGNKDMSAIALAEYMINHFGSLTSLLNAPFNAFRKINGIGITKYTQLQAIKSLSLRYYQEQICNKSPITNTRQMLPILKDQLLEQHNECFVLSLLSTTKELITTVKIAEGSIDEIQLYQREIFRQCINANGKYLIIAHNHPTGSFEPSSADIKSTEILRRNLKIINVELIDHVIISPKGQFIFSENDLIQ